MIDLCELVRKFSQLPDGYNIQTSNMLRNLATNIVDATESYAYYKKANPCCREGDEVGDTLKSFSNELLNIIGGVCFIAGKEHIDLESCFRERFK